MINKELTDLFELENSSNKKSKVDIDKFVNRLMFIFSKELNITPKEFLSLDVPLILDLLNELEFYSKERERVNKKRR